MPEARWTCLCRVADCVAAMEGSDPRLRELAEELYSGARVLAGAPAVRFGLERREDGLVLSQDGSERLRTADLGVLFQEAESALTAALMAGLEHFYQVHAGAVVRRGQAWLIAGPPEAGKTSLVLALALRGAAVLTDEVALIDPPDLRVVPFRRDLIVRSGTWGLFPELSGLVQLPGYKDTPEGRYVSPERVGLQGEPAPAVLALLLFPQLQPAGTSALRRLGQAEAARRLLEQSFNLERWGAAGVEVVASVVERCPAWAVDFADARQAAACLLDSEAVALL